jgi:hypothetical protein
MKNNAQQVEQVKARPLAYLLTWLRGLWARALKDPYEGLSEEEIAEIQDKIAW